MHQLHRERLHEVTDVDRFFSHYLGDPVMQKLEQTHMRFSTWPQQAREALKVLCIHYAKAMPEADHVIRADVGTRGLTPPDVAGEFLMYFGFQTGHRAHYTCVAHARTADTVKFIVYVGGWSSTKRRKELIAAEDPGRVLEGRVLSSADDVARFAADAHNVLKAQRVALNRQSGVHTRSGFCPAHCQLNWNRPSKPRAVAAAEVSRYWDQRKKSLPPGQVELERRLMAENNRYRYERAVSYVCDHVPVEQAWALSLSEHA